MVERIAVCFNACEVGQSTRRSTAICRIGDREYRDKRVSRFQWDDKTTASNHQYSQTLVDSIVMQEARFEGSV